MSIILEQFWATGQWLRTIGGTKKRISVPGYFYPTWYLAEGSPWDTLQASINGISLVVMNQENGKGTASNSDYAKEVGEAKSAGLKVIAYISTAYGANPIADVITWMNNHKTWYDVDGFFIDEAATGSDQLAYYQQIRDWVNANMSAEKRLIALNHGTSPVEQYINIGDILVTFEGTATSYTTATFTSWQKNYSPDRFWHIVYDAPSIADTWNLAAGRHATHLYITPDIIPNPFDTLAGSSTSTASAYWLDEQNRAIASDVGYDTASLSITETSTTALFVTGTDTTTVSLAETGKIDVLFNAINSTDSLSLSVTENYQFSTVAAAGSDNTALSTSESSSILVSTSSSDNLSLTATEEASIFVSTVSESISLGLVETSSVAVTFASNDATTVSLAETNTLSATLDSSDIVSVASVETNTVAVVTAYLSETGDIRNVVDTMYNATLNSGSELYVKPTATNLSDMQSIWNNVRAGNLELAGEAAKVYNYDVVDYTDNILNRRFYLLREQIDPVSGFVRRGWGWYLWAPDSTSRTIYQISHTKSDLHTHLEGIYSLAGENAKSVFFATSHRNANAELISGDAVADVANVINPPSSVLQALHEVTDNKTNNYIAQYHGYSDGAAQLKDSVLWRATTTATTGDVTATTLTINTPATKEGDKMLAYLIIRDSTNVITDPAGWTRVNASGTRADLSAIDPGSSLIQAILYERTATASEPASYQWNWSIAAKANLAMVSYRDCAGIDVAAAIGEPATTSTTTHVTANLTTTVANTSLVTFFSGASSSSWTGPANTEWRELADFSATPPGGTSPVTLSVFEDTFVHPVGTYNMTATSSTGFLTGVFFIVALKPSKVPVVADAILSYGAFPPPQKLYNLGDALQAAGFQIIVNENHVKFTATGNVQGQFTRTGTSDFVHLERPTALRQDALRRQQFDDIVVNFNKADPPVNKSSSDSFTISVNESRDIITTFASNDSSTLSLPESYEFSTTLVSSSDNTTLNTSESTNTFVYVASDDSLTLAGAEASSIFTTISASDTISVVSEEISSFAPVEITVLETSTLSVTETTTQAIYLSSSEVLGASISEQTAFAPVVLSAADTTTLSITEASKFGTTSVVGFDATNLSITDGTSAFVELNSSDLSTLSVTESFSMGTTSVAGTDATTLSTTEEANALAIIVRDDTAIVSVTESYDLTSTINRTDTSTLSITEISLVEVTGELVLAASDSSVLSLAEARTLSVSVASSETTNLSVTETSSIAISGLVEKASADAGTLSVTESTTREFSVFVNDVSSISVTEAFVLNGTMARTDTTTFAIVDTSAIEISGLVEKAADDSLTVHVSDPSTTFSSRESSEIFNLSLQESSSVAISGLVLKESSDNVRITVLDTATVSVIATLSDTLSLRLDESAEIFLNVDNRDDAAIAIIETSTIEISGLVLREAPDSLTLSVEEVIDVQRIDGITTEVFFDFSQESDTIIETFNITNIDFGTGGESFTGAI